MSATIGSFKDKPVFIIDMGTSKDGKRKFTFSFGLTKAKAILENLEGIRDFVENGGKV